MFTLRRSFFLRLILILGLLLVTPLSAAQAVSIAPQASSPRPPLQPDANYIDPVGSPRLTGQSNLTTRIGGLSNGKIAMLYVDTNQVKVVNPDGSQVYLTSIAAALGSRTTNRDLLGLYPIANGEVIITVEGSNPGSCDSNTGNLFAFLRLDATGTIVTPLTNISAVTHSYNCFTRMVELSNGNLAFTYQINGDEYAVRIFTPAGTAVTSETSIQKTGAGNGTCGTGASVYSSAIGANHTGTFLIAYHCNSNSNLYGTLFNNDGTQVTVGGSQHFVISTHNGSPAQSVLGLIDNNYMVVYDPTGAGTFQFRLVQPDGTVSSAGSYSSPSGYPLFSALSDGGFVAIDYRTAADGAYTNLYDFGTIFNNSGNLVQAATDFDTTYSDRCDASYNCLSTMWWFNLQYGFSPAVAGYTKGILYFNSVSLNLVMHSFVTASTVNITGTAGIAGATLNYYEGSAKSTTADNTGLYTVTVTAPWTGTITPTLAGYTFSPATRSYAAISLDQPTQNYAVTTCTPPTSGTVNWNVAFTLCPGGAKKIIPSGLTVILDNDLTLGDDLEIQEGGAFNPNGKTVTLTGSAAQTLTGNPLNFYNLVINKTAKADTVTVSGKLQVSKKLTITRGKLKSASDYGDVEIGTEGVLELTNDITVGGTWINDGEFIANTAQVAFDGTTPQAIGGANQTLFQKLVISPTAGVFITTTPAITDTITNYGVLSQTQSINNSSFSFLQIGTDKYQGVDLTSTDDLGDVSIAIHGNTAQCTSDAGSPAYRQRCFQITVERADMSTATMVFHTTATEDTIDNDTVYQYTTITEPPMWANVGDAPDEPCTTINGGACTASSVSVNIGTNYFLIGGSEGPTAVTLSSLSAAAQPLDSTPSLIILLAALLGLGGLIIALRRTTFKRLSD